MKRFEYAIKAIEAEIQRSVGKVVLKYNDHQFKNMGIEKEDPKIKNMKLAIKILSEHLDNKHV